MMISTPAIADNIFLTGKFGTWSFSVEASDGRTQSTSGLGSYQAGVGFGMLDHFVFDVSFNVLASKVVGGQLGIGFDFGAKYYPFTSYGHRKVQNGPMEAVIAEQWRPYIGAGFRQRQFILVLTSQYVGPGVTIGTEYLLPDNWFVLGEFHYDVLFGQSNSTATQTNILIGLGREI